MAVDRMLVQIELLAVLFYCLFIMSVMNSPRFIPFIRSND